MAQLAGIVWTLLVALSLVASQPSANKTPVVSYSTFSLVSDGAANDQPSVRALSSPPPRPAGAAGIHRIIVKLKHPHTEGLARAETISRALQASLSAETTVHTAETTVHHLNSLSMDVVDLPLGVDAAATCEAALLASDEIDICEPDAVVATASGRRLRARAAQEPNRFVPDDPIFKEQWGMASIDMPEAWAFLSEQQQETASGADSVGKGTVVGVIDTGVDYTHPDLKDAMWVNQGEIAGNGIDDDGNGFVDDIHGWAWCDGSENPHIGDGDPMDEGGHGTHCAGTIAATANNQEGIAGVAFGRTKIIALKFLCGEDGRGSLADAVHAINYAVAMGATLTSNSWGYLGSTAYRALEEAIREAEEADMLFIAAAGNDDNDNDGPRKGYPASSELDSIISVGAATRNGEKAPFSNYGLESVDVFAPGTRIFSTMPGGKYAAMGGTSMATPFVAGLAALLWSTDPAQSYCDIKHRILSTSEKMDSLEGLCVTGGQINALKAVTCADCKWTPTEEPTAAPTEVPTQEPTTEEPSTP
ncbi:unnamed protein product [Vitrella brassicaformis CCMP3155]|uniref:subtilisin n=1 Tax=Vitrella brassicaformis (strain CCMP3155) TaxID=1169540 RepID=A0A0G4FAY9_VITBC|nr:unnamed protein product [Vitrella brassicaformis CCMP3155]|eukprot:CEM10062.1 unnamed protein product [Vitrella brassicaformis CCMP3155]